MSERKKIRLIHTSDTHLGVDWRPEVAEKAFRAVVDSVAALQGDGLLLVGDVFDHARVPDRVLEVFLEQAARLECPVIVLPGNHDLYHQDSLYRRPPFQAAPPNLFLFTKAAGQTIAFPDLTLDLWGRAMEQHTPEFRPLAGMSPATEGRWLVALAHGHFHFAEDKDLRSSPIYPEEVAAAPCDYLALGHWERHVDVSQADTRAFYSGSPLGASSSDDTVSVTVVELDPEAGVSARQAAFAIPEPARRN